MSERERTPDARLVFSEGSYEHALRCYYAARAWTLNTGQCFRKKDLGGIINSPTFRGVKPPRPMQGKWLDHVNEDGWQMCVDIFCATEEVLQWLRKQELPEHARLEISESDDKRAA